VLIRKEIRPGNAEMQISQNEAVRNEADPMTRPGAPFFLRINEGTTAF